jgi:hypothetical protein
VDDATGKTLPTRLYIRGANGRWHFPKSASTGGSAVRYERRSGFNTNSIEMHTTLSAHPFRIELSPGRYTFTAERGKEFFPESHEVVVERSLPKQTFRLRRWIDMNRQGWYSGDTHNHRDPAELPNVMLAEDVNVGLPMVDWTTTSTVAPNASGRGLRGDFGHGPAPPFVVFVEEVYYVMKSAWGKRSKPVWLSKNIECARWQSAFLLSPRPAWFNSGAKSWPKNSTSVTL